jgi:hypothetical protein
MYIIVSAFLIAGAFAIAGAATAVPLSPWLSHIGAAESPDTRLLPPNADILPSHR